MGFIFGLIVGGSLAGGGGGHAAIPQLGSIPFRCLAAIDISDTDYRNCRIISLRGELHNGTPCQWSDLSKEDSVCSESKALAWEIAGLKEMKRAMEAKQKTER